MRRILPLVGLLLAPFAGCGGGSGNAPDLSRSTFAGQYPIEAIATVGMVADLVRHVGGQHVAVTQIMGTGVDPHLYKPTRDDVKLITEADIVFYSGLMLEGKMVDTLVKIARRTPVYAATEVLDDDDLREPAAFAGHFDPHVWMNVHLWAQCAGGIASTLAQFDPDHAADFQKNALAYCARLEKLHDYGKASIATIPSGSRVLVTSHDAFNYFGTAYGLDVEGIQGISTESEAGLKHINDLVDMIVAKNVRAVFVESSVPRKNIEALVDGARARGHKTVIGGELFSDAMGIEGAYEGTYIGMLDHNITTVTRALGGNAPIRGMQGKLSND